MSGYLIYSYDIVDQERIDELGPMVLPVLRKYSGELVAASGVRVLEGAPHTNMVVYKFSSLDKAREYCECAEYQEISQLRRQITKGFVVFLPAIE